MLSDQIRRDLAALKSQAADLSKKVAKVKGDHDKERAAARDKRERAGKTSSATSAKSYLKAGRAARQEGLEPRYKRGESRKEAIQKRSPAGDEGSVSYVV